MLFSAIIGQEAVKAHLLRSAREGRISHAYLLAGGEGSGNLPLAMAFAQYINCLDRGELDSCGNCSSCVKYAKLIHPDLHFVFPVIKKDDRVPSSDDYISSWRSFVLSNCYFNTTRWFSFIAGEKKAGAIYAEEAMSIIRKLSLRNFEGLFKVMIIWLPERMNDVCGNKVLKILEEPPPDTVFILVSDDPGMLLPTILSRLQRVEVPPIDRVAMSNELQLRFSLDAERADALARFSNGNFLKALDNIDNNIERVDFFGLFATMARATYSRKIADMTNWVDAASAMSRDNIKNFLTYSVGMLRDSFVYNFKQPGLVYLSPSEEDFVIKFAPFITSDNLSRMVAELELASAHIEQNGNSKIVLLDMSLKIAGMFKS